MILPDQKLKDLKITNIWKKSYNKDKELSINNRSLDFSTGFAQDSNKKLNLRQISLKTENVEPVFTPDISCIVRPVMENKSNKKRKNLVSLDNSIRDNSIDLSNSFNPKKWTKHHTETKQPNKDINRSKTKENEQFDIDYSPLNSIFMGKCDERVGTEMCSFNAKNPIEAQKVFDPHRNNHYVDKKQVHDKISKKFDRILARNQYIKAMRVAPVVKRLNGDSFKRCQTNSSREDFITPLTEVNLVINSLNFSMV